ncbi:MAG: hypothetical protein GY940_37940 [bacterium]|nr:hypothetical protein [bacterium]
MKKQMIRIALLIMIVTGPVWADKTGTLEEVLKPEMIKVHGDDLLVVEKNKVFIYSIKNFALRKTFGKEGQGPEEFKSDAARTILITVSEHQIMGESRHKILLFNRDGEYVKEIRKSPSFIQTLPVGKNYAVLKLLYGQGGKNYFTVTLHDSEFKELKELYRQPFFVFEDKTYMMPDGLFFCVVGEKIFVDQSPDGYVIGVFDSQGKKLARIEKQYEKIPVTAAHKEEAMNDFLDIPSVQRQIKTDGRQATINSIKQGKLIYPDYFPALQYIASDGKRLYIKTHKTKDQKEEFQVLDFKGKVLKTAFLPRTKKMDYLVRLTGDKKYYTFYNNKFYYLKHVEGEDDEESWEVHVENIK